MVKVKANRAVAEAGSDALSKFHLQIRRFGVPRASLASLLDGINLFVTLRIMRVIELQSGWVGQAPSQLATPYQCRFLDRAEILHHASNPENRLSQQFVKTALAKEDRCFGILDGDTLASFGWYSTRPTKIGHDALFRFAPELVYMYHGYTRPAYRGQRLHSLGLACALRAFSEEDYDGLVSLLEPTNWPSRTSAYGLGFRPFGTLIEVGLRGKTKYLTSRGARARKCHVR